MKHKKKQRAKRATRVMRGISFDCGNGCHAPLCPGCDCDCHN